MNINKLSLDFDSISIHIEEPNDIASDTNLFTPSISPQYRLDYYNRSPSIITPEFTTSTTNSKLSHEKQFTFDMEGDYLLDVGAYGSDSVHNIQPMIRPESRPTTEKSNYEKTFLFPIETFQSYNLCGDGARKSVPNSPAVSENETEDEYNNKIMVNVKDIDDMLLEIERVEQMQIDETSKLNEEIRTLQISNNILTANMTKQHQQIDEYENDINKYKQLLMYFNNKYNENIDIDIDINKLENVNTHNSAHISLQNMVESYEEPTSEEEDLSDLDVEEKDENSVEEQDRLIFVCNYEQEELIKDLPLPNPIMTASLINDPFDWSVRQVSKCLKSNGFKEYRKVFEEKDVSGEMLLVDLPFENLVSILGMNFDDATEMINLIKKLRLSSARYYKFKVGNHIVCNEESEQYDSDSLIDHEDQYEYEMMGGMIVN